MGNGILALTGASGFIGRNLISLINLEGLEVRRLSLRKHEYAYISSQMSSLKNEGVTDFLNLGWPASSTENYKSSDENAAASMLSLQLAEACAEEGIRFFGVGSPAEFSPDESEYAKRKRQNRDEIQNFIDDNKATWLRPHLVFDTKSWPKLVKDAALGLEVVIRDNSRQNFIHVQDVASGIFAAINHGVSGEVDILSGETIKPSELLEAMGYQFQLAPEVSKDDLTIQWNNSALIQTGWRATKTEEILVTRHRVDGNL